LSDKYNYLFSLKPVYINLNPNELQRIATSNKVLSQKEFKLIMNDLITNGYIQPGIMNIVIKIKNRKFEEDNNKIKIIDISREPCSLANDVPGIKSSCISKVTLNYIYYKDNGDIILESEREYT